MSRPVISKKRLSISQPIGRANTDRPFQSALLFKPTLGKNVQYRCRVKQKIGQNRFNVRCFALDTGHKLDVCQ